MIPFYNGCLFFNSISMRVLNKRNYYTTNVLFDCRVYLFTFLKKYKLPLPSERNRRPIILKLDGVWNIFSLLATLLSSLLVFEMMEMPHVKVDGSTDSSNLGCTLRLQSLQLHVRVSRVAFNRPTRYIRVQFEIYSTKLFYAINLWKLA